MILSNSGLMNLHSHQQCKRVLFCPFPFEHLFFIDFLNHRYSDRCQIVPLCSLICITLINGDVDHNFIFWAICISFMEKCVFQSSAHFFYFLFNIELHELFVYFGD